MLNELSLFSGYGGMTLGLRLAGLEVRTIGYVEIEPYCQELLRTRIRDGLLSWAPVVTDITSADFRPMAGLVDIITAGFPCQPHSTASGRPKSGSDPRNLWPDTFRAIREVQPRYVLLENVEAITFRNGGARAFVHGVERDLASIGYGGRWDCIPAHSIGAPHSRWRWWRIAYATGSSKPTQQECQHQEVEWEQQPGGYGESGVVAGWDWSEWPPESRVCGVDDGIAHWLERHKALGNGVIPAVVARFLS